jgi:beta-xylosidase
MEIEPPKPILGGYTADPHAVVFGDTTYVYPTSDKPGWNTTDFSVWSSKDLVKWKNEGMILDVTRDLSWAKVQGWAPAMIKRDDTYFFRRLVSPRQIALRASCSMRWGDRW